MSYVVKHTQCPECVKHGNDRSGDNLALYNDGGAYCFSCGYYERGEATYVLRPNVPTLRKTANLPEDVTSELPDRCREWLRSSGINELDQALNLILWSESWKRLIFPIMVDGVLEAWQGRYFGEERKAKWFSSGDIHEIIYTVGNPQAKTLVLVEDLISAIKVGHCPNTCVMPLFGSHVSMKRLLTIKRFYDMELVIWLDHDKAKEAVKYAKQARDIGLKARNVISERDPKCYSEQEILDKL